MLQTQKEDWVKLGEDLAHLGTRLNIKTSLKVKDFMRDELNMLSMSASIESAMRIMVKDSIDAVPIVDEANNLVGLITKTLVLRKTLQGMDLVRPVSDIMIEKVASIGPDEDVTKLISINVGNLPVVKNRQLLGMVTLSDTIRAYFSSLITLHAELNTVLDSTHNGILTVNAEREIILLNRAAEIALRIKREDVVGRKVGEILPQNRLTEALINGEVSFGQKFTLGKKGYICNITPVHGNGQFIGTVGVFQDISELEMISEELSYTKEIKEELIALIESSFDGIHVTDNNGITLRANRAFCRITGWKNGDLEGKSMQELIDEGVYSQDIAAMVVMRRESVTISQKSKPGNIVMITANPVFDERGVLFRIVINVRDISELNLLRQQLEQAQTLSQHYQEKLSKYNLADHFVIRSKESRDLADLCVRLGQVDATVLIKGESGVGKEFAAQLIHSNSNRRHKPMVTVNCAAIPESLFESELFGYEPGAFTGASKQGKRGLFEAADGGTLFLDEIGETPLNTQAKLLRAIQEKVITRVGGTIPINVDVRIIAATNRNLQEMVQNKEFRSDLYFRLNVIPVVVPPLRERKVEIPFLVDHFIQKFNAKYRLHKRIDEREIKAMMNYDWPGNIRELENLIERLVVTYPGEVIRHINLQDIETTINNGVNYETFTGFKLQTAMEQLERQMIKNALETLGSTRKAAMELGVSQPTIVRKAAKYNIPLREK
ncbi:MAG TPA: sigma 54-interacting transcriptional regulator [Syntrophomonas sp.]|nr:sigma 54-interacting transcriptional regulator [Syntrophomonas sp.]HRW11926.1 sigma 54-interacting transcriptional regulator [Syntrophomonas sp.]